jgi:hypothetical protein
MDSINDVSALCWECNHCKPEGEHMVGTDATGGGPEDFVSCKKGWNQIGLRMSGRVCPDRETNYDIDY